MSEYINGYDPMNAGFDNLGNGLIFTKSKNENEDPYTTDIAIAKATGFTKKYVDEKIRTHKLTNIEGGDKTRRGFVLTFLVCSKMVMKHRSNLFLALDAVT